MKIGLITLLSVIENQVLSYSCEHICGLFQYNGRKLVVVGGAFDSWCTAGLCSC